MIVETSALVAILLREPNFEELVFKLAETDIRNLSAASYLEASIVLVKKRGEEIALELDRAIHEMEIAVVPVTADEARAARSAFLQYGKGRHPAQLNFGDCFAYALAKTRGEALLCKGNDFTKTDLELA
jgi:ribonuclease VapC